MGGKNDGSSEAAQARADEVARQERIRSGTSRINSIFDGGTVASGLISSGTAYDPTATYYTDTGSAWSPTTGSKLSAAEQFAKAVKDGSLYSGTTTTTGFDDSFYDARKQAYIDYASPQVEDQYSKANKELTYALARGGNLNSSVRGEKAADLQKLYDLNMQDVADKALSYETQARNNVEDARANLITTLNATGDAEQAASSAIARSQALSQPAAYSPLGQLFADFTNTLGIQAAQERAAAASGGTYKSPYNTGLFGTTGRVSVTN